MKEPRPQATLGDVWQAFKEFCDQCYRLCKAVVGGWIMIVGLRLHLWGSDIVDAANDDIGGVGYE